MSILTDIGAFFLGIESDVLAAVKALIASLATNGGTVLVNAAASGVASAEAAGGTGAEKLAAAQTSVVATLTGQGIPVVMNAVNAAIEAAVAQMKANQAAASPAPVVNAAAAE